MDWHALTHGMNGLIFAAIALALPLWIAMLQRRAPIGLWLLSPICVLVLMLAVGLLFSLLGPVLKGATGLAADAPALIAIGVSICAALGYLSGLLLSRGFS